MHLSHLRLTVFACPALDTKSDNFHSACRLIFSIITGLQASAWLLYLFLFQIVSFDISRTALFTLSILLLVITLFVACILWRATLLATVCQDPIKQISKPLLLASLSLLQAVPLNYVIHRTTQSSPTTSHFPLTPGELVRNDIDYLVTDTGTRIVVYDRKATAEQLRQFLAASSDAIKPFANKSTLLRKPSIESNCHGWAFTDGKHTIRGEDVQQILNENGYVEICSPEPNDLIIYRDAVGAIVHTGIVRIVPDKGDVLIESKWGAEAVYLHKVDVHPYSRYFAYWRANRENHTLALADEE